jgi:capsular polysaccharide biosynthesis protein
MDEDWVRLIFDENIPAETTQRWHGVDWEKRPPRMLRDFSSEPLGPITIQTGRQTSQPRRLDRLRDVHLTWSSFFIAGDRCASIYNGPWEAVSGIVDWPGLSKTVGMYRKRNDFVVPRSRLLDAERIAGRTMFASSDEPHNWGMWLLYVLPAVFHFVENRHAYDRLFVYADHPNMRAMLRLLGLKAADVILHDCSRAYHFESVDVFRQPRREFFVAQEAKAMFAKLREKVAGSIIVPSAHHIYIGRRRRTIEMSGYRPLANEGELVERLAAMGYSPIDPEYLGPEEQIELFGSERRIVVLGGAGLFNAVFCKPGTKIVDIESIHDHLENHSTVLSSVDADYGVILGQVDRGDPAPHNKQWTVDVERATAAIAEFMS